jgi:hypothetical protein
MQREAMREDYRTLESKRLGECVNNLRFSIVPR